MWRGVCVHCTRFCTCVNSTRVLNILLLFGYSVLSRCFEFEFFHSCLDFTWFRFIFSLYLFDPTILVTLSTSEPRLKIPNKLIDFCNSLFLITSLFLFLITGSLYSCTKNSVHWPIKFIYISKETLQYKQINWNACGWSTVITFNVKHHQFYKWIL